MDLKSFIFVAGLLVMLSIASAKAIPVYFGTYTRGGSPSKGIYRSTLDLETGRLSPPVLAAETTNPSFLAIHPNRKFLYAEGVLD